MKTCIIVKLAFSTFSANPYYIQSKELPITSYPKITHTAAENASLSKMAPFAPRHFVDEGGVVASF